MWNIIWLKRHFLFSVKYINRVYEYTWDKIVYWTLVIYSFAWIVKCYPRTKKPYLRTLFIHSIGCDKLSYSITSLTINSKSMASHMFPKISSYLTIKHNFLCPFHCMPKPDTSCSYNIWRWPDVRICIRDTVTNTVSINSWIQCAKLYNDYSSVLLDECFCFILGRAYAIVLRCFMFLSFYVVII